MQRSIRCNLKLVSFPCRDSNIPKKSSIYEISIFEYFRNIRTKRGHDILQFVLFNISTEYFDHPQ